MSRSDILALPQKRALRMTARAMKSAAWVNWNLVQQSPTAYMLLLLV